VVENSHDGVAGGSQACVALCVISFGARAGVAGTVDLDDQAQARPVEVDLEVFDLRVDKRFGQAGVACKSEEAILEFAARAGAARVVEREGRVQDVELWRPLARVMAARTARSSNRLRYAASWMTFASWCARR